MNHRVHERGLDTIELKKRTRAYPPEFKARLVAEADQPGASVVKVALAHGLNANMLHTWRREARGSGGSPERRTEFVPLSLPMAAPVQSTAAAIRIELRHGVTSIAVAWPVEAADACAAWVRELNPSLPRMLRPILLLGSIRRTASSTTFSGCSSLMRL